MTRPHDAERIARVRGALERVGLLGLTVEVALAHHVEVAPVLALVDDEAPTRARHALWTRVYRERFFSRAQIAEVFDVRESSIRRAISATEGGSPDEPIPFWPVEPDEPIAFRLTETGEQAAAAWGARRPRPSSVARKRGRAAHAGRTVAA